MKTSHTPGPWHIEKQRAPNGGTFYDVTEAERQAHDRIAMVGPWTATRDGYEAERNARLIAAAPDLLAALEEIAKGAGPFSRDALTHASNTIDYMKEVANAAIRKARGEA